jgi:pilus assembly protein CpaB
MTAMRRRFLALLAAFLLAAFGAAVLIQYVRTAEERAQAGEVVVPVYVVTTEVGTGTDAGAVSGAVTLESVPARLLAPGAVQDQNTLAQMAGMVTGADLLPGEQLVTGRFVDPSVLLPVEAVPPPEGTQEVSLTLEPQRAVDGHLVPGSRVGVFVTVPVVDAKTGKALAGTGLAVTDVLVTRVSGGTSSSADGAGQSAVNVTLAVAAEDAATVISGMAQNAVWLSLQSADPTADTSLTTTSSTGDDQ